MLSKAQSKYIRSLTQQKFRNDNRLFIAEGSKVALEWLAAESPIKSIVATAEWHAANVAAVARHSEAALHIVDESGMAALTALSTPGPVLLVIPYPDTKSIPDLNEWYIALDEIQDPGNMGTIIRIADWFGIRHLICSPGCVDFFNPKVVQSAMGSHIRVNIYEAELAKALPRISVPKFAATLHGSNAYEVGTSPGGVLIIGNEARGVSAPVMELATHKITIPRMGGAESLNAAVSAGILCALLLPRG